MAKIKKPTLSQLQDTSMTNLIGMYLLAAVALAALVGFFAIRPIIVGAQETKAEVERVEGEIAALERLAEDTEELRRNYEVVRDERDRILGLLPHDDNEEEALLALLSEVAQLSGVMFTNFRPETGFIGDNEGSFGYQVYDARVTVSGTNDNLRSFLDNLERSSRFVGVRSLLASTGSVVESSDPTISLIVMVRAYYQTSGPGGSTTAAEGGSDE